MPYHVRITTKSNPSDDEVALDLSKAKLEQRFVQPYNQGRPIVTGGKTISPDDIERMRINATREASKVLLPRIRAARRASNLVVFGIPDEWYVTEEGENVTDDFITGAPGALASSGHHPASSNAVNPRTVFVIHGRDLEARDSLFAFLRSLDLHPLEWSEALNATAKPTPYIGEILDEAFSIAQAVIVLMTPDDEARLREPFRQDADPEHEINLTPQARPNVLFEAGMAMGRSPDRTVLVELGALRPFSDIAGRHVVRLDDSPEKRQQLVSRLQTCGCKLNLAATSWLTAGTFTHQ